MSPDWPKFREAKLGSPKYNIGTGFRSNRGSVFPIARKLPLAMRDGCRKKVSRVWFHQCLLQKRRGFGQSRRTIWRG